MPNHITTKIYLDDEEDWDIDKKVCDAMKSEESMFDFSNIIPYPKKFKDLDDAREKAEKDGVSWDKLPKDGYNNGGYDWCVENWGTKWNAYDIVIEYGIKFETAWSHPLPVIRKLSKMFPTTMFKVVYADEDTGHNLGGYFMKNGKSIYEMEIKEGGPMAKLFAHAVYNIEKR